MFLKTSLFWKYGVLFSDEELFCMEEEEEEEVDHEQNHKNM